MPMSYKGSLAFGLIYIPITLHAAVKKHDIGFNMLHKKTGARIQYKKTAAGVEGEVKQADIVKGYQYDDGKYVVFEDEDFEKIKSKRDKQISITQFVKLDEIDPVYFEKSYYVVPTGAEKAFALLLAAMKKENRVGIAKTVLGTKETLIAIRASGEKMLLNTLYFDSEVQKNIAAEIKEKVDEKELGLAELLIENMTTPFDPAAYKDEYREKLLSAIDQKIAGKEIVSETAEPTESKIVNLMEALQASVKATAKEEAAARKEEAAARGGKTGEKKPAKKSAKKAI